VNYLKLWHPDRSDLIELLEKLRPLEYLSTIEKRIAYLKRCQAEIVCHLIDRPLQIENHKFENVIVLDTEIVEDSDILNILNETNPGQLRLYGNGPAARRLRSMPPSTVNTQPMNQFEDRPMELSHFLGYESQADVLVPGVISVVYGWNCPTDKVAIEVCVASAFVLRMLGFESILIVSEKDYHTNLKLTMKRRSAWWSELAAQISILDIEQLIEEGRKADIVVYLGGEDRRTIVANHANLVFWFCHCVCDSASPCLLALEESVSAGVQAERNEYPVTSFRHLLALSYSMQRDKFGT
jgi:hypothetical protein